MKIAFTTKGTEWESKIDSRFGRANYFVFYDEDTQELSSINNKDNENDAHGAGPKAAQILFNNKAQVLITGNGPGGNASTILEKIGVVCYIEAQEITIKEAYNLFKEGKLKKFY